MEISAGQIFSVQRSIPSIHKLNPNLDMDWKPPPPTDSLVQDTYAVSKILPVTPLSSREFVHIIKEVEEAIGLGIYPELVLKGSSGAYFCKNKHNETLGIFKPKDEEPYGKLNPKWTKWLHRNLLPCCFGRSCIIPNSGYLSETAASYIDRRLGLGVVPRTEIVYLASRTFNYKATQKWSNRIFGTPLPKKIGSFQIFLKDFEDSTSFFQDGFGKLESTPDQPHPLGWDDRAIKDFQKGFERLVILDYLIRNTDRGSDNWMIKDLARSSSDFRLTLGGIDAENHDGGKPQQIQIGAIDNGLAFPTKHPNRIRSYPYGWLFLPIVHYPFTKSTANEFLPYLTSSTWWEETLSGLEKIFSIDDDFKSKMWEKQKAVIRGQGYNLLEVLSIARNGQVSPFDLANRPLILIHERHERVIHDDEFENLLPSNVHHESLDPVHQFLDRHKLKFKKIKTFIKDKSNICLQFPDHLLYDSPKIAREIQSLTTEPVFILADTTMGSCCIDKVAGEHGNAGGIIHFGPACLSVPSKDCPPVLWIFENLDIDISKLIDALSAAERPTLVLTETGAHHILEELERVLDNKNLIFSELIQEFDPAVDCTTVNEGQYCIQGRQFTLPSSVNLDELSLFYIGKESLTLTNILMTVPFKFVSVFDIETGTISAEPKHALACIRKRFVMVQKAKDANVIGIVVGTLGVANYLDVIQSLKNLILACGKKPYLLAVGKPSPVKLGNFLEIDCFVLIACPENSLLDSREFLRPVVTPYELSLALDSEFNWNPNYYELNLSKMAPKILDQIKRQNETDSDNVPHFSLITGGMSVDKHLVERVDPSKVADDALVKKWDGTVSSFKTVSAGAQFLNNRTFKGLEVNLGSELADLEIGRSGIARGYISERLGSPP